jgi:hypothetical protein
VSNRIAIALATLYVLVAIVTFGHAAVKFERQEAIEAERCRVTHCINFDTTGEATVVSAIFWPFYWSWELQS